MSSITLRPQFFEDLKNDPRENLHLVTIATKPDIIKQAPIYLELKKRGELTYLCHTGQHFDFNLSGGLEEEFGITPDCNLNISGEVHHKAAQTIERLGDILVEMKKLGKIIIPYVHGDTFAAMTVSNVAYLHQFASVHVEAGIRTLTPKREFFQRIQKEWNWDYFYNELQKRENWTRGSIEPYPEQFNTRSTETATGIHMAPVELDREFLLAEGFSEDRIKVVGNTVADATKIAEANAGNSTIFEQYPLLKKGEFIRFCIHRRENTGNEKRFGVLFSAIKKLVEEGYPVLLISLYQTEWAIDNFSLREEVKELQKKYPHFIYSSVWPYYTDVIAAMKKAACCVTDSGSMQEEMNILGIPCVTLRFGSDRAESILAGANVLAPPCDADLIVKIIKGAMEYGETMRKVPNLYGEHVSQKIIDEVLGILKNGEHIFRFEEERLQI